ncbi:MAG: tRNA (adenosine(37)-N6)-threonylcarbamoyltransferase complex ATPase subunit type 1 TsaE [Verrucomicrobia bacterium CG_4_10_14_3_um_filter_43_23]|nr:MAG: tRNA (adenosine(37)-N6)-threonylcarbamoyltransferase complex ATPase subunit type 1 TsaE [Verrucomicrobia bacterium CG1_02_43_26]PIP59367.1 MAG: tRNA (adenosine(37)-N6)-threonylcarbamoyltransferase complex ATPase subunit type 1 TsaE [Verrucomicrobia bacterium CG22_combo_CG10-13_8_21_14_all_43_17]PIX57992.1 MAG: tRNA (adenosine(37)-N6)-threonylcarbamoyltransferase complex ATPase subunit type 1 TsaE [Verrucomicrobia bacterium CG_4_10_14_3_um_filter_43_23]PIY61281.1 MAG: tRNA (adenosine(37)-
MTFLEKWQTGILSHSAEETEQLAAELANEIPEDWVLALHGTLGVGKTTFVRGLARAWGITGTITSPTYTLFNIYKGKRNLVHLDAYRIESQAEMENLLLEEFLVPPFCLAVEWPRNELLVDWNEKCWHLYLSIKGENQHFIQLKF